MTVPLPGRPVRGSSTGRPVMAALDLLGRRWTLRILWELREGPVGFRALRSQCDDVSPSVLSTRLGELVAAGVLGQDERRTYAVTPLGADLLAALAPLQAWADRWAAS